MKYLFTIIFFLFASLSYAAAPESNSAEKYGVEKRTTDTATTRTDTYTKELGKTDSGNGYGVYGSSTREFKDWEGERETSANEVEGSGSVGAGVYMGFE